MKKLTLAAVFALTLAVGLFATAGEADAVRGRGSDHPRGHSYHRGYDDHGRNHGVYRRHDDNRRYYRYYRHY